MIMYFKVMGEEYNLFGLILILTVWCLTFAINVFISKRHELFQKCDITETEVNQ